MVGTRAAIDTATPPAINTTPLIDVLLVLLILMILSIPLGTHKVPLDLPRPAANPAPTKPHTLAIDHDGALRLDGAAVSDAGLAASLAPIVANKTALLTLSVDDETRYERFDQVLARVKDAGVSRLAIGTQIPEI